MSSSEGRDDFVVTPAQQAAVDKVARFVVRFGLTAPAILALEGMRPLSFVGSQFMHLLTPSIAVFLTVPEWEEMARLLEDRRGLEHVIRRIESLDRERTAA
ncbi:MAG: hypothetical protein R3190_02040 [Thermoanaerobaculia bacterium]|nr:hypothetical protein [Thermoanaerobaculia bacterium]